MLTATTSPFVCLIFFLYFDFNFFFNSVFLLSFVSFLFSIFFCFAFIYHIYIILVLIIKFLLLSIVLE